MRKIRFLQIALAACLVLLFWLVLATKYALVADVEGIGLIYGMSVIPAFIVSIIWYISECSRRKSELSRFDWIVFWLCWVCLVGVPVVLIFG